jgi:hypothetical protein
MAGFTRVNGDYLPVAVYDAQSYTNPGAVNSVSTGLTVQPQGPKLQFFTVTATGALSATQVNTVVQTVQQLATIYMYEYTDAANDTLAMAVYPVNAWTAAAIDTALTAAGVTGTTTSDSATFTN